MNLDWLKAYRYISLLGHTRGRSHYYLEKRGKSVAWSKFTPVRYHGGVQRTA